MTRNTAAAAARPSAPPPPDPDGRAAAALRFLAGRPLVLVGLMGAGKSTIGRRVAARLRLPFLDADAAIEEAAGCTISEIFARYGESEFRTGERRVIARLLAGPPAVVATGGGAVTDAATRALLRTEAVAVWLRVPLPVLARRVAGRAHRPLLAGVDPLATLERLHGERAPFYGESRVIVDCGDDSADRTADRVLEALGRAGAARRVAVPGDPAAGIPPAEVLIGPGLLAQAGAILRPLLPQPRAVVVTDATVAALHLPALLASLAEAGIAARPTVVAPGEASKRIGPFGALCEEILAGGLERRTAIVALGGGVVGDLAGFAAATLLRGVPFVQIPTTLLAQVDSSVGGKTGINAASGKNLIGAFHQPLVVLADTDALATLSARERRCGYAEIVKAGLIGDRGLFEWCEANGPAVIAGDPGITAEAVDRACRFKAAVVAADWREVAPADGRALLNLGHSFAHALEAEGGYDGRLLHGEAVAIGCALAFRLSVRLGLAPAADAGRVSRHLAAVGLPDRVSALPFPVAAATLAGHMARDKKMRDGVLTLILARGIGAAFTARDAGLSAVEALLRDDGAT